MPSERSSLLVFDGDCAFCRLWIDRWKALTGDRVVYAPLQEIAREHPDVSLDRFRRAVHLIDEDGKTYAGAEAVFRLLAKAQGRGGWLWAYRRVPGLAPVTEAAYRFIARRRGFFFRLTTLAWGGRIEAPTYGLTGRLLLQALAVVYFVAFVSLFPQIPGLIGERGLLPAADYLAAAEAQTGPASRWLVPSLAWLDPTAGALQFMALAGAAAALLALGGILTAPMLLAAWVLYLSLVAVGQDFLSFQWDALLLEAGFLAVFLVPFRWTARYASRVAASPRVLWLFRWLLFRLMFGSGLAKLAGGDRTWRNLTAMAFHFETQPLPTPAAWWFDALPAGLLKAMTLGALAIELVVPFLYFAPRRLRASAAAVTVAFQILLMLTGNFAFFNWLTLALCLPLIDDALLGRLSDRLRKLFRRRSRTLDYRTDGEEDMAGTKSRPRRIAIAAVTALSVVLGALMLLSYVASLPRAAAAAVSLFSPFRVVNRYGLFAAMTTSRPEIVIEGSDDGVTWKEYAFRHKPGDVKRSPGWVAPHQPRLDWQMWFAALGEPSGHPWFPNLLLRLLQGSPEATRLLAENPFPASPPKRIRATLYLYRFSSPEERARDGAWWRREMVAPYFPEATLTPAP